MQNEWKVEIKKNQATIDHNHKDSHKDNCEWKRMRLSLTSTTFVV